MRDLATQSEVASDLVWRVLWEVTALSANFASGYRFSRTVLYPPTWLTLHHFCCSFEPNPTLFFDLHQISSPPPPLFSPLLTFSGAGFELFLGSLPFFLHFWSFDR